MSPAGVPMTACRSVPRAREKTRCGGFCINDDLWRHGEKTGGPTDRPLVCAACRVQGLVCSEVGHCEPMTDCTVHRTVRSVGRAGGRSAVAIMFNGTLSGLKARCFYGARMRLLV